MSEPLLHDRTRGELDNFVTRPSHALLIVAPTGSGKTMLALHLASQLLETDVDKLANHPYFKQLSAPPGKSISIDSVRDTIRFLMLKAASTGTTSRVVVIENATAMTVQAQNALLKTIEEPPAGTVLILTAASQLGL